jgi:hypothetical protein
MIVGFDDWGAEGSHHSNAVRKSNKPDGHAINTIADRMRRLSSKEGPLNQHDRIRDYGSSCRASVLPERLTRQGKEAGTAPRKGAVPPDPPAISIKSRSGQEAKSRHKSSDKFIVEFPTERRINSTVRTKERGAVRGSPINEILSLNGMNLDRKTTSCPEKNEQRQSMQHPHASMRKDHNGKHTHQFEDSFDWSQTSINWADEED